MLAYLRNTAWRLRLCVDFTRLLRPLICPADSVLGVAIGSAAFVAVPCAPRRLMDPSAAFAKRPTTPALDPIRKSKGSGPSRYNIRTVQDSRAYPALDVNTTVVLVDPRIGLERLATHWIDVLGPAAGH